MKKWVRYDDSKGRLIDTIDKKRVKRTALEFKKACDQYADNPFVQEIYSRYSSYVEQGVRGLIELPLDRTPSLRHIMEIYDVPELVGRAHADFSQAVKGAPAVKMKVGFEYFHEHRAEFFCERGGDIYIYEEFED